jgi:hypothetical protein
MPFKKGVPRSPNAGRKPGVVNKATEALRANLKSAVEICRSGDGLDPVSLMLGGARILQSIAMAGGAEKGAAWLWDQQNISRDDLDRVIGALNDSINAAAKVAQFGYPKLAAMEWLGDAPVAQDSSTEIIVTLRIDDRGSDPIMIENADQYGTKRLTAPS